MDPALLLLLLLLRLPIVLLARAEPLRVAGTPLTVALDPTPGRLPAEVVLVEAANVDAVRRPVPTVAELEPETDLVAGASLPVELPLTLEERVAATPGGIRAVALGAGRPPATFLCAVSVATPSVSLRFFRLLPAGSTFSAPCSDHAALPKTDSASVVLPGDECSLGNLDIG